MQLLNPPFSKAETERPACRVAASCWTKPFGNPLSCCVCALGLVVGAARWESEVGARGVVRISSIISFAHRRGLRAPSQLTRFVHRFGCDTQLREHACGGVCTSRRAMDGIDW